MSLVEWNDGLPSLEVVRMTPRLALKTPSTFAEAARNASLRMKERELSALTNLSKPTPTGLIPRKIFSPAANTDSTGSSFDHGLSPCSTIPPTLSPMSPLGNLAENEITGKLISLAIDDELSRSCDSFSSAPDTAWNKGAVAFIDLLEDYLARQTSKAEALKFESLVVEMMDINISSKVPTSGHIAATLEKGWNMEQVASVWSVSTANPIGSVWNDQGIEQLAGRGALSRIWNKLKSDHLTGFPKRPAQDDDARCAKKQRFEVSNCSFASPTTPSMLEVSDRELAHLNTPTLSCPRKYDRKLVKAKRRDPAGLKSKITWWFSRQPATPDASPKHTPARNTPLAIPGTPSTPTSMEQPKKQRKARKRGRKQQQGTETTPARKTPEDSKDPTDASPVLQPHLLPESSRRPKIAALPSSSKDAKMTPSLFKKAARHSSTPEVKQALDRKWNCAAGSTTEEND